MWSYLQKKALHTALPRCLEIRFLSCNFGSTKPLPSYAPLWKQQTFDFWSVDTVSVVWPRFEFWIILWTSVGFRWVRSLSHRAFDIFDPSTGAIMKRDRFPEGESPSELIWARKQRCGRRSGPAEPWSQVMCLKLFEHQMNIKSK